jgi:hypothetical protein
MFWLYGRSMDHTLKWINEKFSKKPDIAEANIMALKASYNYGDITETIPSRYIIKKTDIQPGTYRKITGNETAALGLIAAAELADKDILYGTYPITPASNILHELSKRKNFNVKTLQAEDEIAACGMALGAAFVVGLFLAGYRKTVALIVVAGILATAFVPKIQSVLLFRDKAGQNRFTLWTYSVEFLTASPKNFVAGAGVRQFFRNGG